MSPYRAALGHPNKKPLIGGEIMMINPDFEELRRKLIPQVGPPTYPGGNKRQPTLNQQFFARLAKEVFNPIYEKIEDCGIIPNGI